MTEINHYYYKKTEAKFFIVWQKKSSNAVNPQYMLIGTSELTPDLSPVDLTSDLGICQPWIFIAQVRTTGAVTSYIGLWGVTLCCERLEDWRYYFLILIRSLSLDTLR